MSEDGREPGDDPTGEPVGSVAEEAAKLFGALGEALNDWTGDWTGDRTGERSGDPAAADAAGTIAGLAGQAARAVRGLDEHLATGAPECTYCPVCRTVHAWRRTSPEVRAHLTTAASALVQAASGLLATTVPDQGAGRSAGVEHIHLDPDPEEDGR